MSKVSGKIRDMQRKQAAMEERLAKIDKHQDLHSRNIVYMRRLQRQSAQYMKSIHQHFMGTKKGRKGLFARVRTLEIHTKAIISVASILGSAAVIGILRALL